MPLFGLYLRVNFDNVESIKFEAVTQWTVEAKKARTSVDEHARQQVTVSETVDGHIEWGGLKGVDRTAADRSEREGSIRLLKESARTLLKDAKNGQFDAYDVSSPGLVLVAVFDCIGCEPTRLVQWDSVVVKTSSGRDVNVEHMDMEAGWCGTACDGEGSLAFITGAQVEFMIVK